MANFLRDNLGFEHDDVRVITDENPWDHPTVDNIMEAMAALVYDAQPNDSLVFYCTWFDFGSLMHIENAP
ncbi:hypothetical protein BGY98DRAFT_1023964 [Russula aff. rugulosa BPL654]|nr:hypothetical protein BGY98DRAFT_1023964 [Russula aff. rugulosa BPL654]